MGVAIAYNPCGWCPYKENGERCEMCELTFRRKEWISVEERLPESKEVLKIFDKMVHSMPAADVVPKSEVERLETEVRLLTENSISAKYPCHVLCSKGLILTKSLEEYDKLLADISSEVAREIFEEIETIIRKHDERPPYNLMLDLYKLKKKYTEENK